MEVYAVHQLPGQPRLLQAWELLLSVPGADDPSNHHVCPNLPSFAHAASPPSPAQPSPDVPLLLGLL